MNNGKLNVDRSAPITLVSEGLPPTGVSHSLTSNCQIVAITAWTCLRDAVATYGASWVGFATTLFARQVTRSAPNAVHVFSGLDALAVGATTYAFGSGLGTQGWHPHRRWIGSAAAVACTALLLYTIYAEQNQGTRERLATSWCGAVAYSFARDLLQSQSRRIFPEVELDPSCSLHFEGGRNTCKHIARLVISMTIYTLTSIGLSPAVALNSILSANFSDMNQDLGLFARESSQVFGVRALNESSEALVSILLLALFFREDIRRGRPWFSNQGPPLTEVATGGSSRTSMNLLVNALHTHLPTGAIPVLQGLTLLRAPLLNLKWRPWQLAQSCPTKDDGDCLLHAADGAVHNHRWTCTRVQMRRDALCRAIRDLAGSTEGDRRAEGHALVDHHLQQAAQQSLANAHVPGFVPVLNGADLLSTLPEPLLMQLEEGATIEDREAVAGRWLADASQRQALLNSVADFYAEPGRYLPTLALPCLARALGRPLALHEGEGTTYTLYNPEGDGPFAEPVHIRHAVSPQGEAGDHFERIERSAPRLENGRSRVSNPSDSAQELGQVSLGVSTEQTRSNLPVDTGGPEDVNPLNGRGRGAHERITPTSGQNTHIEFTNHRNGGNGKGPHPKDD
ncbi:hypothetical protein [Hydrogenophaga sp. ANAO-22]|uniref:hypothetical protein n=1 Tax=Hydrogenophaga sp. ANAO-22 TaxID=3166645 RepID=UPI0036D2DFE7